MGTPGSGTRCKVRALCPPSTSPGAGQPGTRASLMFEVPPRRMSPVAAAPFHSTGGSPCGVEAVHFDVVPPVSFSFCGSSSPFCPRPPPKKKPRCRDRDRHREELPLRSPRESRGLRLPSRLLARCAFAFRRGTGQLSRAVLSQVCAQVCAQVIAQVCAQVSAQVCAQVSQLRFPGDCPPFPRVLCFQGCCRDERGNL